ncbi:unnamed protein product [Polarella glacialis]|uniref:Ammonium transporter n=1 Tax=Polarella glacialis TaxID=89957 RepID=A0A813D7N7_POLGL|nr:unnamed protein product [Polarella glacialis]
MVVDASDTGDVAWMAISSALVLLMTPGLAFYYGGLVRAKNILNTMMMSVISMGLISMLCVVCAFSLAFKGDFQYAGLQNMDVSNWPGTKIPCLLFAIFQMTFAIIAAAIISGAVVERIRFGAFAILISLWVLFVYCPLAYWIWGGGWIAQLGAKDFAGGTVVHISSGSGAFVTAMLLGKRKKSAEQGMPHNVPFVILGASILWFGWTGFNGGSALAADEVAVLAVATTFISAAGGMVSWAALEVIRVGKPSTIGAMTGSVAGLVTITPIAGYVSPMGSLVCGIIGSLICSTASLVLERSHLVDDSLDAFSVHCIGGFTGAILGGFFDTKDSLLYGASGK